MCRIDLLARNLSSIEVLRHIDILGMFCLSYTRRLLWKMRIEAINMTVNNPRC